MLHISIKKIQTITSLIVISALFAAAPIYADSGKDLHSQGKIVPMTINANYTYANKVLSLVNSERAKLDIAPLQMDERLLDAGMMRSAELVFIFDHYRPNGELCYTAIPFNYYTAAENIACGQNDPAEVVEGWMNSPGHRDNILNPNFTIIGIGSAKYRGCYYWTQLFSAGSAVSSNKSGIYEKIFDIDIGANPYKISFSITSVNKKLGNIQVGNKFSLNIHKKVGAPNMLYMQSGAYLTNKNFSWNSGNNYIATVNSSGKVTAKKPGKTKITANYKGQTFVSKTITIRPIKTKLTKVTRGKKKAKLTWKKVNGITKYEIAFKQTDKSKWKTKKVSSKKKTFTINKLTKGKKYQFKIRSYKIVSGEKIYSPYSAVRTVKIL